MKYGHADKKTGISLHRDVYFEQFAERGDKPKITYSLKIHGDTVIESNNPKKMANQIMNMNQRMYGIADFLRRVGVATGPRDEPSGDK